MIPVNVRRHTDVYGGSGWLYEVDGRTILEHCCAGRWGACELTVKPRRSAAVDPAGQAAIAHLARRPHLGPLAPLLSGPDGTHAGGGVRPYQKGPVR